MWPYMAIYGPYMAIYGPYMCFALLEILPEISISFASIYIRLRGLAGTLG